jgi:hypothetical protein
MANLDYMNRSSKRGIFLSIILLFSIIIITIPSNVYAEEVSVKSFAFEETTIIEIINDSDEPVNSLRIWLGSDFSFKSFKTEKGWVGEKTPQGVIIFTSSETINPGESVKFGVKTDKAKPGINWKTLDKGDNQISIGKVLSEELPDVVQNTKPKQDQIQVYDISESIFRIVPEKPNVGSSIRVTGDKFAASQEFDFYIDSKKIGSFETDKDGHFMTTMKIPEEQKADRVDFKIIDKNGGEKKISLRIGENDNRIPETQNVKLTIKGLPDIVHRGDFLEIFGTGDPGSAITAEVANSDGEIINSRTAEIDSKGNWKLSEPIIVALDTPFGKYSATITDGRQNILKHWTVESDKVIIITPSSLKFDPGEVMKFNGTALPNNSIEVILEDPLGKEVFADIIQIDDSGYLEFEFTTTQSSTKGTYTLIATQGTEKEFIFAGIGQLPSIPVNLEFDKLNYKAEDTAIISLIGKGSDIVSLLIIDPSDKPKGDTISITLQPDGRGSYSLNLEGYASGVYTAVISKGSTQNTEIFAVGLQTGSGNIEINTTKLDYLPGDSILILGDTAANSLLTITLIDPDGNEVKIKETFSDKSGKISEGSFRIPSAAQSGMWEINVKSGANFDTAEIEVLATLVEGMQISVEETYDVSTSHLGKTITIKAVGVYQSVEIEIIALDGEIIQTLIPRASAQGEVIVPWLVPKDTEPGIYTFKISDATGSAETTFELK